MRNLIVTKLFWSKFILPFYWLNCDMNIIIIFGDFLCQWVDFKIFSYVYITYRVVSIATEPELETGS